jgi:chitinase
VGEKLTYGYERQSGMTRAIVMTSESKYVKNKNKYASAVVALLNTFDAVSSQSSNQSNVGGLQCRGGTDQAS